MGGTINPVVIHEVTRTDKLTQVITAQAWRWWQLCTFRTLDFPSFLPPALPQQMDSPDSILIRFGRRKKQQESQNTHNEATPSTVLLPSFEQDIIATAQTQASPTRKQLGILVKLPYPLASMSS